MDTMKFNRIVEVEGILYGIENVKLESEASVRVSASAVRAIWFGQSGGMGWSGAA